MALLDSINFELVLGSVLAFVSLLMIATKPPKLAGLCRALIGLALLLLLVISVRVPGSPDPVAAWDMYMERVVKFSFWAIFIAALVRSPRDLRWFIGAFLVACGYICFESVRGGLFGGMMWQNQGVMRLHGTTLLFRHPNSLAGLALGLVPFAYYLLPLAKSKLKIAVLVGLIALALTCVLLTGSRTAYIGVIALAAFIALRGSWSKGKLIGAALLTVLVAVAFVPAEYKARFETIFTGQEIEGDSMGKRREIIEDSFKILASHPLGVGVAGFQQVRLEKFGRHQDTHNLYLQVATQLGIPGLAVFLAFLWVLWRRLGACADWRLLNVGSVEPDRSLTVSVARAAQAYLLVRIVLGLFGHDLYEVYWWLALGLAISLTGLTVSQQQRTYDVTSAALGMRPTGIGREQRHEVAGHFR